MKTVFSASFDLTLPDQLAPAAMSRASDLIRGWVMDKYARAPGRPSYGFGCAIALPPTTGVQRPLSGHVVGWEQLNFEGRELSVLTWEHPGEDPNEVWQTNVTLAHNGSHASATIHTRHGTLKYSLRPMTFTAGIPVIVRELVSKMSCSLSGWPLPSKPYAIPQGQVERFALDYLLNPNRSLPIIVVSRDVWTDQTIIQPERWARTLGGLAEIAVLENKWAGFQLTDELGKELSCYGGAVRIYWPGFTQNSKPGDHRLWFPDELRSHLPFDPSQPTPDRKLAGFLCAISVISHKESATIVEVRGALDAQRDEQRLAARTVVQKHSADVAQLERILEEAWQENDSIKLSKKELETDLTTTRAELYSALQEIENRKENLAAIYANQTRAKEPLPAGAPTVDTPVAFTSVLDAYLAAKTKFGGADSPVIFLDTAEKSASESPYLSSERVYFLIKELHGLATKWRDGNGRLGTDWKVALASTGFEFKPHISATTESKYGDEYYFMYEGKSRLFEQHVTKGAKDKNACFSLHMFRDDKKFKIVIGHCGNHLTNTSS